MKNSCCNCKYIEWVFGDIGDSEGFICNRKYFNLNEESKMIKNMDRRKYRDKAKVCFIPKTKGFI